MTDLVLRIEHGDCIEKMQQMYEEGVQVDAIVTDTPYHLTSIVKRFGGAKAKAAKPGASGVFARAARGFMGKSWDGGDVAFRPETWAMALNLLKPGGHLVAFGGSRTYGRLQWAIEQGGFEIRDGLLEAIAQDEPVQRFMASLSAAQLDAFFRCIEESQFGGLLAWVYGSGMPKSHDQAKMIDKKLGVRGSYGEAKSAEHARWMSAGHEGDEATAARNARRYLPASAEAQHWQGWGTGLKPAFEPIILARKPLIGSVPENLMKHGVGALNIDACRIDTDEELRVGSSKLWHHYRDGEPSRARRYDEEGSTNFAMTPGPRGGDPAGRWPANFVHDGSDDVLQGFPDTLGQKGRVAPTNGSKTGGAIYEGFSENSLSFPRGDVGNASRFFYSAKAGVDDRLGTEHPTVKTIELMRWLVRLVTPRGGVVLDPFAGSGTTGHAAWIEGVGCILIEMEADSIADIRRRMDYVRGAGRHSALEKARLNTPARKERAGGGDLPLFNGSAE